MDLEISQRQTAGIRILDLRGKLVIGQSESLLRSTVAALRSDGCANVILNLAKLGDMDDDGLSALVYCYATLRRAGGALKLLNLSRVHMDLLVQVKLDTVFEVFQQEDDAINSFFPDRAERHYDILEVVEELEKP